MKNHLWRTTHLKHWKRNSRRLGCKDAQLFNYENHPHSHCKVMKELTGDKSLERFRVEYEKLHRALKKSHESEKRLMHKCRELNAEIVANASKVTTALKMSQEDKTTIASLKQVHQDLSLFSLGQ